MPRTIRRPRGVKLVFKLGLTLIVLPVAAVVGDKLVGLADPYGIGYYHDVRRYYREAIELSTDHEEEGERGRLFQNRAGLDLAFRSFSFRTDAHGLRRGREESGYAPAREDALRILFLGDSVTLAWGVDDETSWVRLVETEGRTPARERIRCLNAGHMGYDTVQAASLLKALGPRHRPDVVVVTFLFNDVQPTWSTVQTMLALPGAAPGADAGPGALEQIVARALPSIGDLLLFRRDVRLYSREDQSDVPPYSFYPEGWPRCATALDALLATCDELEARLVVFDHTMQRAVPELTIWCDERDVPLVDLRYSEEELALGLRNSTVDGHANGLGNRLLADKALRGLRALEILGRE